jgi:hypothetical protein
MDWFYQVTVLMGVIALKIRVDMKAHLKQRNQQKNRQPRQIIKALAPVVVGVKCSASN